jgi:hypothetical protein
MAVPPYGYSAAPPAGAMSGRRGTSGSTPQPYSPEEDRARAERRAEQEAQDAYNRYMQSLSLGVQLAGQGYQNQAQNVYNANQLGGAQQQLASIGYGLGQDLSQQQLALGRGQVDLAQLLVQEAALKNARAQQEEANRRYGFNLDLDLGRARGQERAGPGSLAQSMFRR